jgi:quinol monooxygenase YgiN
MPPVSNGFIFWKKGTSFLFWMGLGAIIYGLVSTRNKRGQSTMAWTLSVTLTFSDPTDLNYILTEWTTLANYCDENEEFLYHYEVGIDDSNPLIAHIIERYKSKDEYLHIHKKSEKFLKFRSQLKELQDTGKVTVSGFSFQESGRGFTSKSSW